MSSINAVQQVEDQKLIRLSQAADTKAFDRLVGKYHAKVFTRTRRKPLGNLAGAP